MKKWKTKIEQGSGSNGKCAYHNYVIAPDGTEIHVNIQHVIHAKYKPVPLSNHPIDRGYVTYKLVEEYPDSKPQPDELCEFIVNACNKELKRAQK